MTNQLLLVPKEQQTISPKIIRGLHVLSLPVTALDAFINQCMIDNPLLESNQVTEELDDQFYQDREYISDESSRETESTRNKSYWEKNADGERQTDNNIPETETLHGFLHLQLALCHYSKIQVQIGEEIIDSINEDGYFCGNLCEIAYQYGQPDHLVKTVFDKIQTFSPAGIGATSLKQCLLNQVNPHHPQYKWIRQLIQYDLPDLAGRHYAKLSNKYEINKKQIQKIFDYIHTLNPRPGMSFGRNGFINYIIPDIVVKRQNNNQFSITVNDSHIQTLSINDYYSHLANTPGIDCMDKNYICEKRSEAKILINQLHMRCHTLQKIASCIVQEQIEFFRFGPSKIKALTMKRVAEAVGVHISTISRAVKQKYMDTPWGIYSLKYFFSSSFRQQSKQAVTEHQIKSLIRHLIDQENPNNPLSDQEIMSQIKSRNIDVSRRTIAKYRHVMGIERQHIRRYFS